MVVQAAAAAGMAIQGAAGAAAGMIVQDAVAGAAADVAGPVAPAVVQQVVAGADVAQAVPVQNGAQNGAHHNFKLTPFKCNKCKKFKLKKWNVQLYCETIKTLL